MKIWKIAFGMSLIANGVLVAYGLWQRQAQQQVKRADEENQAALQQMVLDMDQANESLSEVIVGMEENRAKLDRNLANTVQARAALAELKADVDEIVEQSHALNDSLIHTVENIVVDVKTSAERMGASIAELNESLQIQTLQTIASNDQLAAYIEELEQNAE